MGKPLDSAFIEGLLKAPQAAPKTSRARKPATFSTAESRTFTGWFTVVTRLAVCSNPDCPDKRELRTEEGNAMCGDIGGITMCRVCFLDGYGVIA
jgi:hypothetical protein